MESFLDFFNTEVKKPKESNLLRDSVRKKKNSPFFKNSLSEKKLPPEPEHGNIEYKLKLVNPSSQRFEHLVTQLKWRLQEGQGEAIYKIGVEDNGKLTGLSSSDMKISLETLREMAGKLGATVTVIQEKLISYPKFYDVSDHESTAFNKRKKAKLKTTKTDEKRITEVLIRKLRKDDHDEKSVTDLRLAVMGGHDAGKSTLLGVLTQGELDNGRGRSRLNMLRHLHEIKSGRTSSISHEIIGFDKDGHVLNYSEMITAEEICEHASKIVTLIDLAGHRKYLRTTLLGLTGYSPHYVMLVVAPPVTEVVQEHMALCLALGLPFFVVVTKIDLRFCNPSEIISELKSIARSQNFKKDFIFHTEMDSNNIHNTNNVVSVFTVSSVTGAGLNDLTNFMKDLAPTPTSASYSNSDSSLFQIDETFRVVGSPEPVLGGLLVKGTISLGAKLLLGPSLNGEFVPVKVLSLHRNKAPCTFVRASQSASLTLTSLREKYPSLPHLRPGMVLLSNCEHPQATLFFQATVVVVYHATAIYPGFQATVHVGNVRQTCIIEGIMAVKENGLKTNESASILLRFLNHPEYLHVEMRLLLRESQTKAIGTVTQIFPLDNLISEKIKNNKSSK